MSFSNNNNNQPKKDPTLGGSFDGRTPNEARFIDFPNNPDMYGHIDPYQSPGYRGGNSDAYPQHAGGHPLGNFAPPGQLPTGFDPNSPLYGVDGQGSLVMKGKNFKGPQRGPPVKGDVDMMVANGIIDPPPQLDPTFGGFGEDSAFSYPQMRRPGMGGPPGMRGPRGMGGSPGFGGPPGFGGGFV